MSRATSSVRVVALSAFAVSGSVASAAVLPLVNGSFEAQTLTSVTTGADRGVSMVDGVASAGDVITGWTSASRNFYLTSGLGLSTNVDPTAASQGTNFITANRTAPSPDTAAGPAPSVANPAVVQISQAVSLAGFETEIDAGLGVVSVDFDYFSFDAPDTGAVSISYLDGSGAAVGVPTSFPIVPLVLPANTAGTYRDGLVTGLAPAGARSLIVTATAARTQFSATNISYDNFAANIVVPEPATLGAVAAGATCLVRRRRVGR